MRRFPPSLAALVMLALPLLAEDAPDDRLAAKTFAGLKLRAIGPALKSGRVVDVVFDPEDRGTWYVAAASGGVWKTTNAATTWTPVFDGEGSYSIGCLAVDPANPHVVWVGTGENNSQRSAGYGDGVYKSLDGGESWRRVGLERSEHVGKIVIDPRDSDVVYVAAQGPLWAPGGERGLYKTSDGGATWTRVLHASDDTGVSDVALDPRDPDVLYAASYQRRRRQWTLVAGGPESAIYKSTDAGATWRKLTRGLPEGVDVGRIGLAVSPHDPDVVYATIAAARGASGFYRSANRGESWVKASGYVPIDPQYYMEVFPDPHRFERLYQVDVFLHVSDDGGRTWRPVDGEHKHVDHHALAFDPADPDYLLVGTDGGIYQSWDLGKTWKLVANLPITQFYRVGVDDAEPFYNVYGGTQDNDSQGGPSRTTTTHGIRNADWFVTAGGDGYQTRVDPTNPDIVYSMWQYGHLVRYDKKSGEVVDVQPQPGPDDEPLKWNWDSPFVLSPHSPTRLYFAGSRLFVSDDRGDSWRAASGDLTRGIDRNTLKVMGRVWSVDAVWKNVFTSFYGAATALAESPLVEGLLYVGTDDGLVHVTEDGGAIWRRIETFPGVPERTLVVDLTASNHDADVVYALFNNHKSGDFNAYVLKSEDRGRSWSSIAGRIPERHVVWSLVEDHEDPELLFLGTEFGLFFRKEGRWIELTGGVPTVAFRDLEIQRRENDLVAASFGRGFFILDDYTPLRHVDREALEHEAIVFPVKRAWMYLPSSPLGWGEKDVQGHAYFTAPNPPFGAVVTYYLRDAIETREKKRQAAEDAIAKEGGDVAHPGWEALRAEDHEEAPAVILSVTDADGRVVRRLAGPLTAGFHRVAWDLRLAGVRPIGRDRESDWEERPDAGPLALPGTYTVALSARVDSVERPLGEPRTFEAVPLGLATLPAPDRAALAAFQAKTARLQRAALGAAEVTRETSTRLAHLRRALLATAGAEPALADEIRALELRLHEIERELFGDRVVASRQEPTPPSLLERVDRAVAAHWTSTSAATGTHRREYEIAAAAFAELLPELRRLVEVDLAALEEKLEAAGTPWTPGRGVPEWQPE